MKKKIIMFTILVALAAVPVFAATTDQVQPQNEWFNQMLSNHKQMVQQAVDNGTVTVDQAAQMDEHMQQMAPTMQNMMQNGNMMGNSGTTQSCGMKRSINNNTK